YSLRQGPNVSIIGSLIAEGIPHPLPFPFPAEVRWYKGDRYATIMLRVNVKTMNIALTDNFNGLKLKKIKYVWCRPGPNGRVDIFADPSLSLSSYITSRYYDQTAKCFIQPNEKCYREYFNFKGEEPSTLLVEARTNSTEAVVYLQPDKGLPLFISKKFKLPRRHLLAVLSRAPGIKYPIIRLYSLDKAMNPKEMVYEGYCNASKGKFQRSKLVKDVRTDRSVPYLPHLEAYCLGFCPAPRR
ncbi:unnamed protein product, partial [marine sediment metagenome]